MYFSILARASFSQERIFSDEHIRFSAKNKTIMYVIPLLYRLASTTNHLSITRLCHAFRAIIAKHNIFRTAIYLDANGTIIQHVLDASVIIDDIKANGFSVLNLDNDGRHIDVIINEILKQPDLFDLSKGRVIHCHILRRHSVPNDHNLLAKDDLILFSIHHAVFDGPSISIFIRDLSLAYENYTLAPLNDNTLQYIDYSIHERVMNMTSAHQFWHSQLRGYQWKIPLALPVDRHRFPTDQRSGLAFTIPIIFHNDLSISFLNYASAHHITPFQLGLATFYLFLFKLTHTQNDLCITCLNANRYRSELQDMIGMFVSTLPYRLQFDTCWSFDQLVRHVQEKCLSILEHSHYPLQHILTDFRLDPSNIPFLETLFDFITISSDVNHFSLNDACFEQVSTEQSYEVAKFDFSLIFVHDPTLEDKQVCCSLVCSRDLFEETTTTEIGRRFEYLCEQLFVRGTNVIEINKVCLILPEEAEEVQSIQFHRLENVVNEGM